MPLVAENKLCGTYHYVIQVSRVLLSKYTLGVDFLIWSLYISEMKRKYDLLEKNFLARNNNYRNQLAKGIDK